MVKIVLVLLFMGTSGEPKVVVVEPRDGVGDMVVCQQAGRAAQEADPSILAYGCSRSIAA